MIDLLEDENLSLREELFNWESDFIILDDSYKTLVAVSMSFGKNKIYCCCTTETIFQAAKLLLADDKLFLRGIFVGIYYKYQRRNKYNSSFRCRYWNDIFLFFFCR